MTSRFDIVGLGEAMIEFIASRAGDASTWLQGFGGDTSNAMVAAARLGARTGYVTRVGDDAFGRRLV
ncbi:MAG TPA: PfkB family carbohydrate kinase, partial [Casimicrobiaceae bacterium]|nr:PfkB family carbohydrate kinase [Casimicrobiaceae bacterium]